MLQVAFAVDMNKEDSIVGKTVDEVAQLMCVFVCGYEKSEFHVLTFL